MRKELRLWLEQRVTGVLDSMVEHRDRLNMLRLAVGMGIGVWAPRQVDLPVLVGARVTVDEAWVAVRDSMGSLRAALALAGSPDRRLVIWVVGDEARDHLVDAIDRGRAVQGRLKRADARLRAMAFLFAGDATRPALLAGDIAVAREHLVGAVQAWDQMLMSLEYALQGLAPFPF